MNFYVRYVFYHLSKEEYTYQLQSYSRVCYNAQTMLENLKSLYLLEVDIPITGLVVCIFVSEL